MIDPIDFLIKAEVNKILKRFPKEEAVMTHDELLDRVQKYYDVDGIYEMYKALRAVVELHQPYKLVTACMFDDENYPCKTIQAIEEKLR
jgi:hypothetical protein